MKKGIKITLGLVALVGLGFAVYYLVKSLKPEIKDGEYDYGNDEDNIVMPKPGFETKPTNVDTLAFQKYVLNVKKDNSILGSAGADDVWGTNTSNAWKKYGVDYLDYLKTSNISSESKDQTVKSYDNTWYELKADTIENAVSGLGTDESKIQNVFTKIKTNSDYWALKSAYGQCDGDTLSSALIGDMFQWELDRFVNKPMKSNGVTVWVR